MTFTRLGTQLYNIREVIRQEGKGSKPYVAHIFKYSLTGQFPIKPEDLRFFCLKALQYNSKMKAKGVDIRTFPCFNNIPNIQRTVGGVLSYVLFELPDGGFKLSESCEPHCIKERICRYGLKNIARGLLESFKYTEESKDKMDLRFALAKDAFYFGVVPKTKSLQQEKSQDYYVQRTIEQMMSGGQDQDEIPFYNHFIVLPFFKFYDSKSLENQQDPEIPKDKKIITKQNMVYIGQFLITLYKGLKNSNLEVHEPNDNFDPNMVNFKNMTDIYSIYNQEEVGKGQSKADEYFGVKDEYVNKLGSVVGKQQTHKKALQSMDDLLKDSYYEFIFKLTKFDPNSQKQFKDYDDALKHKFLEGITFINIIRSDTSSMR